MAGGFTIKEKNIESFRELMIKNFEKKNIVNNNTNLYLDTIIAPSALNEDFFNEVNSLAPFGSGNSEPRFVIENIKVLKSDVIAQNHIKTLLSGDDGSVFKAFAWNAKSGPLEPYLSKSNKKKINIAGRIKLNEWRGEKKVEFLIEDVSLNN